MKLSEPVSINARLVIPAEEIRFSFARSSGPGGQHVNKVSTKAQLRWSVKRSEVLSDEVRARLLSRYPRRINDRGELVLTSGRYRERSRNVADCVAKLQELVREVATRPQRRRKTRPTKASKEARLEQKRLTGEKKRRRRPPKLEP